MVLHWVSVAVVVYACSVAVVVSVRVTVVLALAGVNVTVTVIVVRHGVTVVVVPSELVTVVVTVRYSIAGHVCLVLAASHELGLPPPNPHISVESLPEGTLIVATLQDKGPERTVKL